MSIVDVENAHAALAAGMEEQLLREIRWGQLYAVDRLLREGVSVNCQHLGWVKYCCGFLCFLRVGSKLAVVLCSLLLLL